MHIKDSSQLRQNLLYHCKKFHEAQRDFVTKSAVSSDKNDKENPKITNIYDNKFNKFFQSKKYPEIRVKYLISGYFFKMQQ